jgi:hypothetical protein
LSSLSSPSSPFLLATFTAGAGVASRYRSIWCVCLPSCASAVLILCYDD